MKVMVFGTFDILHPGHIHFIKQAKKHGLLTVVVARDSNVKKLKGNFPHRTENERKQSIEKLGIADKVMLGDKDLTYDIIRREEPDVICLGYDQDQMKAGTLFPNIKFIRLDAYKEHIYKSSKLKDPEK